MKKILLFALMFFSTAAVLQAQGRGRSVLKLRLSDRSPISVNVDGRFFDEGTATITIGNLPAGPHRIEVFSETGYRMRPRRVYTGTVRLAPETVNIGTIDLYNRGMRLRTRPLEGYVERGNDRPHDPDRNDDYTDNKGDHYTMPKNDRAEQSYGDDVYGDNRSGDYHNNESDFSQGDMSDLRSRVNDRITDSEKEKLMKNVLQNRTASTDQIREMLGWLSFESTRLDFAKWSFSRAADRENYWKLEDVFTFSSSKEEFNDAIRSR